MSEKAILEALQKAVIAAVTASTTPSLPVKYVGRNFTKPSTGGWLEVIYIPNNIDNEFWNSSRTYRGILRLILHWGMDDKGAYAPMQLAASIASYFAKGSKFSDVANSLKVNITDNANLLNVIEEPPEMIFPISIRYQCFIA